MKSTYLKSACVLVADGTKVIPPSILGKLRSALGGERLNVVVGIFGENCSREDNISHWSEWMAFVEELMVNGTGINDVRDALREPDAVFTIPLEKANDVEYNVDVDVGAKFYNTKINRSGEVVGDAGDLFLIRYEGSNSPVVKVSKTSFSNAKVYQIKK